MKERVKQSIVLIVFVLILLFQMIYYAGIENPPYESLKSGDAATYVFPGQYKQIVLPRVPIYSYVIAILKGFLKAEKLSSGIVSLQVILYFISVIVFYNLCKILWVNRKICLIATICYGCAPGLIWYNKAVRVESLSISLFIMYIFFLAKVLVKKDKGFFWTFLIGIWPGILILLRPSFLFLMIIPIVCLIGGRYTRQRVLILLLGEIISILLLVGQSYRNHQEYGIFGITDISTYNQLVICFDTGLYVDNKDQELIHYYEKNQNLKEVYDYFGEERCSSFFYSTYFNHFKEFALYNYEKLCNLGSSSLFVHGSKYVSEAFFWKDNLWGYLCRISSQLCSFANFSFLYLMLIVELILIIIKKKKIFEVIIWLCMFLQFLIGFFGAQNEWSRMIVPVIPIMILWFGSIFYAFCNGKNDFSISSSEKEIDDLSYF